MNSYSEAFETEFIYHIFTHANAHDNLFKEKRNYYYFLKRLKDYLLPIADVLAYSLLPNYFHLLLKFKTKEEILKFFREKTENEEFNFDEEHKFLMQQISNFLNSYSKSFNNTYGRKGTLFINFLKRKKVADEKYLMKVLHYIHNNAVNHGIVNRIEDWEFTSYNSYLNMDKASNLKREFILEYFDDRESFVNFHKSSVEYPFLGEIY